MTRPVTASMLYTLVSCPHWHCIDLFSYPSKHLFTSENGRSNSFELEEFLITIRSGCRSSSYVNLGISSATLSKWTSHFNLKADLMKAVIQPSHQLKRKHDANHRPYSSSAHP
jgi:hypothetical protein